MPNDYFNEITKITNEVAPGVTPEEISSALKKTQFDDLYEKNKKYLMEFVGTPSDPEDIQFLEELAKKRALNQIKTRENITLKPKFTAPEPPPALLPETPSTTYIADDPVRDINIGEYRKVRAIERGLKGLGAATGVGMAVKDIQEKNAGSALIDLIEGGASLGGKFISRVAPFLELLRSTDTATEEQEMAELEKHRRKFKRIKNIMTNGTQSSERSPAKE